MVEVLHLPHPKLLGLLGGGEHFCTHNSKEVRRKKQSLVNNGVVRIHNRCQSIFGFGEHYRWTDTFPKTEQSEKNSSALDGSKIKWKRNMNSREELMYGVCE